MCIHGDMCMWKLSACAQIIVRPEIVCGLGLFKWSRLRGDGELEGQLKCGPNEFVWPFECVYNTMETHDTCNMLLLAGVCAAVCVYLGEFTTT